MDDMVKRAMVKWPNVPHCYGWLGLDTRGNWFMRDDHAQSLGSFTCGLQGAKGSLLKHEKLISFIQRNYHNDDDGRWYFQNGPQRVYVELASTPWIWRVDADFRVTSHCGQSVEIVTAHTDENGWLYLNTSLGFGLVHSQDVEYSANAIEAEVWELVPPINHKELEAVYKFLRSPEKKRAGAITNRV